MGVQSVDNSQRLCSYLFYTLYELKYLECPIVPSVCYLSIFPYLTIITFINIYL